MQQRITGSLQKKNGKYYAVINLPKPDGGRVQKWINTGLPIENNKRKAEQKLREIISEYESKRISADGNMMFWQLMEIWLESVKTQVRESTYKNYKLVVNAHIIPYFKEHKIKVSQLQPHHLEEYYAEKRETLSPNTLTKHHANMHSALEYARKNHIIYDNVARDVSIKKQPKVQTESFYSKEEIKELFKAVEGDVIETPVKIAAQYGLRRSEALGLKWTAIDFDNHTLTVKATVINNGSTPEYVENTKSLASRRQLPMSESFEKYLLGVKAHQEEMRELLGNEYHDDGFVCARDNGEVVSPETVSHRFTKILERNNLRPIRFHDLRHSAATNLLESGFNLKDVSTWLGHADISTTLNIYAHVTQKAKVEMADALSIA